MRKLAFVVAASTWTLSAQAAPAPLNSDDMIAGRQAGFDLQQGVMAAMKAAIEGGQSVKPFADGADALVGWAKVIPTQFPAGTEAGHDTKAKPEIWSDPTGFTKAAANAQASAERLAVLAKADDRAGFAEQFQATGKTCGACHRAYKVRQD